MIFRTNVKSKTRKKSSIPSGVLLNPCNYSIYGLTPDRKKILWPHNRINLYSDCFGTSRQKAYAGDKMGRRRESDILKKCA